LYAETSFAFCCYTKLTRTFNAILCIFPVIILGAIQIISVKFWSLFGHLLPPCVNVCYFPTSLPPLIRVKFEDPPLPASFLKSTPPTFKWKFNIKSNQTHILWNLSKNALEVTEKNTQFEWKLKIFRANNLSRVKFQDPSLPHCDIVC